MMDIEGPRYFQVRNRYFQIHYLFNTIKGLDLQEVNAMYLHSRYLIAIFGFLH
jgi:hypothetical protein